MQKYVYNNKHRYGRLSEDTFEFISVIMGMEDNLKLLKRQAYQKDTGGYNMCEALEEMINEGKEQGEELFAQLSLCLLQSSRLNDLSRAVADKEYRNVLYKEFGL